MKNETVNSHMLKSKVMNDIEHIELNKGEKIVLNEAILPILDLELVNN